MLALPIFVMANYVYFDSGSSCEANGAGSITTLAGCEAAAVAMGSPDKIAEDDGLDGHPHDDARPQVHRAQEGAVHGTKAPRHECTQKSGRFGRLQVSQAHG